MIKILMDFRIISQLTDQIALEIFRLSSLIRYGETEVKNSRGFIETPLLRNLIQNYLINSQIC